MKIKQLLPIFLLITLTAFSQGYKEKREQIKALKVSYFTTQLNLTSEESAKFWPVYNAYEEKQFSIRHEKMRPLIKKIDQTGTDSMTDKEAEGYLEQLQEADEQMCALRKKLMADLKGILGPVRVLKLKKAEDDFNRKLLSKYKDRKK